ncbi:carbohydrate kinase family protein [Reichenbachiella sp. MALMAid0571]|uniref:carbohydrate kinase family protein n=1 Tax=Reichenbachiella sp. MALMAid0571 TaxID=3143939 RepID=UPI0032DFF498
MKEFDILTIGDLNVDIILNKIESAPVVGKEILCEEMETTIGGSATNFAYNASSLGSKVAFLGMLGNDTNGHYIVDMFQANGINTEHIVKSDVYGTGATVALSYDEDRAMVTYQGAMAYFSLENVLHSHFTIAKHMHVASIFLQPGLKKDVVELFARAKKAGMTTSLDPQFDPAEKWDLDLKSLLPHVDIFLPNETELCFLTGIEDVKEAVLSLEDVLNCIVVKQGSKGSLMYYGGEFYQKAAYLNDQLVDAIGAGDSFDAGFIHKLVQGRPYPECQDFGNLTGAVSTTGAGGTAVIKSVEAVVEIGRKRFSYEGN